ncbi:putative phage replisome organizer [Anaerotaenia torta]|uniref:phage replisome organizer N-terminal domain-containing protein n=1 Tax=Anaerotaenia torta TaxID=433293 RepID=UPI003D226383
MSGVKWIQLNVDIFSNPKVEYLRSLKPDGNNLVLVWIMLLAAAGRSNAGGKICITESVPMDAEMLAKRFDFKKSFVDRAIDEMSRLNMIHMHDGFITITGWEEHQNSSGLEKIREQNRIRKQRQRDNESKCHVTRHNNVTHCHATDIESEKEIEKDIKNKKTKESKEKNTKKEVYFPNDEKLNQIFLDFVDMRKKIKSPMTERAISMMIKKINDLDNDTAIGMLEQSIINCWKDIYPLKDNKQGNKPDYKKVVEDWGNE